MEEEPPTRHTRDKIQDEHSCISFAFQSLKKHQQRKWLSMCCLGVSKFRFIISLEIPKEKINGWVNILGIERV